MQYVDHRPIAITVGIVIIASAVRITGARYVGDRKSDAGNVIAQPILVHRTLAGAIGRAGT